MAAFEHFRDLNDIALKPRLLNSLLKEQVPDETRPFRNPSELSSIVSIVKTHQLLSESIPNSADQKHVSSWKSAVDAWVNRILTLSASNLPDKRWVGVCLLGVTCTECSSERFLASYSDWFNALLSHIQPTGVSPLVKVASCAAVSDLLIRLGGFSNLKKDGTSHANKLVQPILKMLNENGNEAVLEVAAHLLSIILTYFPSSVLRHHDNAEGAIVSKIMSGSCGANSLKKLASCLASLPKSRGDEESWSLMMQKILLSMSALLNDALEGLEEESRRDEAVALLVPPGKERPSSLGGQMMEGGEALNKGERSQQMIMSTMSSLTQCCCGMLTSSYPVQVEIPVRSLLAIVRRVLMVGGSLPESLQPFTTAMQQEFVCSQLPILHLYALDVLAAVVKGIRSQLLPYAADIVRILMGYLKKGWLPQLRTKIYSIIRVLLISMGGGMAVYISQELINNVYIDLNFADPGSSEVPVNEEPVVEATLQRRHKKRKHGGATRPSVEQHASFGSEVKAQKECPTMIALRIAAIKALEALLAVGGALRSDGWRGRIDHLLIEVATNASRGGSRDGKLFLPKQPRSTWEDFQLVAFRALLSSLLSPAGVRPPYLAQGLELFCKGKQRTGSKVAEFCAQALLALEVLVHPRALPMIDTSLSHGSNYSLGTDFGGPKHRSIHEDVKFSTGYSNPHDVYDFLNDLYQENDSGIEVRAAESDKNVHFVESLSDISKKQNLEESNILNVSSEKMILDKGDAGQLPVNHADQIEANGDRVMLDQEHHDQPGETSQKHGSNDGVSAFQPVISSLTPSKVISDADASDSTNPAPGSGVESMVIARADNSTLTLSVVEPDDEDSFPDIVDAEPDPDSDSD